jgi:cell surface protein SprA
LRKYGADINYVYSAKPKTIQPFSKSKILKKPIWRIFRDFNFDPYPSRFSFGSQLNRNFQEMKMRSVSNEFIMKIDSTVSKDFNWNRRYEIKWDLTRSLKLDYSANNSAQITEPPGAYDWFEPNNKQWKDSVWKSMWSTFGRNMNYNQSLNISYNLPINKIPFLNWINIDASYGATYSWVRGEDLLNKKIQSLGNTVKNSNTMKLNSNFNLRSLYTKVNYLKKLDSNTKKVKSKEDNTRMKTVEFSKETFFKKDVTKTITHKLKTEDVVIKVIGTDGKEIEVKTAVINENKVSITAGEDISRATVTIEGKVPKGKNPLVIIADNTLRLITGFKNANVSWSRTSGTLLPGYLPETSVFGMDYSTSKYKGDPGLPFAFGWQDRNITYHAIDGSMLTREPTFSKSIVFTKVDNFSYKTTYEPFSGFRIDLSGTRNYAETNSQLYYYDSSNVAGNHIYNQYFVDDPYKGGNFSISVITISTAFEKVSSKNHWESASFNRMKADRTIISARQYNNLVNSNVGYQNSIGQQVVNGYYPGYGATSQDVLIPAFLAAYTKTDPKNVSFSNFPWTVMPNWRITFDGLSKIAFFQKYFKTISLTHSYKSIYSIGGFSTNPQFYEGSVGLLSDNTNGGFRSLARDRQSGNMIPELEIESASINEQFSPLIGVSMTWINDLLTNFEYGKSRMIALIINNNQVNESRDNSYTIGAGYKFKEVPFTLTTGGNKKQVKSDLNVKLEYTTKKNVTILRPLPESVSEKPPDGVTAGSRKNIISVTADYAVSKKLNIQLYYDRTLNDPYTSASFLNAETNFGFSLRLTL